MWSSTWSSTPRCVIIPPGWRVTGVNKGGRVAVLPPGSWGKVPGLVCVPVS